LRVLLVNKLYHPVIGGVETHVRDLARYLPLEIDRKVLVCSEDKSRKVEVIDGVEVIKARSLGIFRSSPVPAGFSKELTSFLNWADVYHFHFPFPPGEFSFLHSRITKPLVVTYHSDIVRQKFLLKLYEPFLIRFLKRANIIIATSPAYIKSSPYLSKFEEKCTVVPVGIDTQEFLPEKRPVELIEEIRKKVGSPFVLFVGRLIYYKGVQYLIEAFKMIRSDVRLVIIGKGKLENDLRKLVDDLLLSDRIIFLEPQPYEVLKAYYWACELFVLPSVERSEAFGLVLLEAQACGKPAISTELGTGTSYANLDGVTGFVVPPRNPEALADAIEKLISDDELRREMGETARKRVFEEFDVRVMAERVAEVYRKVSR
jgi:rhamnosyl/mannosyltransferase